MCIVRARRNHLVEDALDEIARQYRRDLFKPLRVHFIGEEGIDAGAGREGARRGGVGQGGPTAAQQKGIQTMNWSLSI
jgi:hypothetical protein